MRKHARNRGEGHEHVRLGSKGRMSVSLLQPDAPRPPDATSIAAAPSSASYANYDGAESSLRAVATSAPPILALRHVARDGRRIPKNCTKWLAVHRDLLDHSHRLANAS